MDTFKNSSPNDSYKMAGIFEQPRNAGTLCKSGLTFSIREANICHRSSWWAENQRSGHSGSKWYFADAECWQDWAHTGLVLATQAIANVVKSSFGPSGLDKMMVDDIGVRYPAKTH